MKTAYISASVGCAALLALAATVATGSPIDIWQATGDLPVEIEKLRAHELKHLQKMDEDVDLRLKKLLGLDSNGNGAVSQKEIAEVMRMLSSATMWHQENGDD